MESRWLDVTGEQQLEAVCNPDLGQLGGHRPGQHEVRRSRARLNCE